MNGKGVVAPYITVALACAYAVSACSHKSGGVLKITVRENAGSASLIEDASICANTPLMGDFNRLVVFDQ